MTQKQYDAIGSKDPLTIYLISDYVDPLPDLLNAKFDKGTTGPTTYTTAELMEQAILQNAADLADIDITTDKIKLAEDRPKPFYEHIDVNGKPVDMENQADVNEYIAEQAFFKGMTWGQLAGRP